METYITHDEASTHEVADEFASQLIGGEVVELIGDLGAGKTTFVRGVAKALGVNARVKSPTFTVMNEYPVDSGSIKRIVHLDLYRFKDPSQLEALALEDERRDDTVIFIEWPNIFNVPIDGVTHQIEFKMLGETQRKILVQEKGAATP